MSRTILNLTAICDKAGRPTNQDNFWICPNLSSYATTGTVTIGSSSTEVPLTEKGALLIVADGMGGMNAGEVASQLVIDSIKSTFSNLQSTSSSNTGAIKCFIKQAIIEADREIKTYAKSHLETQGMGSTIVLAWILDKTVYVGWCGDSRAYCYNAQNGLVRLTHDHSYVQDLVDNNKISEEDAFDHPDSNIITRSLGDSGEKANPDVKEYPLHTGDIFLLCSDGLCGLLRDTEIEQIMSQNANSIGNCLNALWQHGSSIGWTDNTTIELVKIIEGGIKPPMIPVGFETPQKKSMTTTDNSTKSDNSHDNNKIPIQRLGIIGAIAFVLGLLIGGFITKAFFPSYPADVEDEIKFLKSENDSLRMVITKSEQDSNDNNNGQLAVERHVKADAEASVARERKAKEEAERKAIQERVAKEENDRKTVEVRVQEETRRAEEEQHQITKVISPEYKEQIRKTQQDFAKLKEFLLPIISRGRIYPDETKQVKDMLKNMNNNLSSIEDNDSYQHLDSSTKNIIKELKEETTKIEIDFKTVLDTQQTYSYSTQITNS